MSSKHLAPFAGLLGCCQFCGNKAHVEFKCFAQTAWESNRRQEDEIAKQIADWLEKSPDILPPGNDLSLYDARLLAAAIIAGDWRK